MKNSFNGHLSSVSALHDAIKLFSRIVSWAEQNSLIFGPITWKTSYATRLISFSLLPRCVNNYSVLFNGNFANHGFVEMLYWIFQWKFPFVRDETSWWHCHSSNDRCFMNCRASKYVIDKFNCELSQTIQSWSVVFVIWCVYDVFSLCVNFLFAKPPFCTNHVTFFIKLIFC